VVPADCAVALIASASSTEEGDEQNMKDRRKKQRGQSKSEEEVIRVSAKRRGKIEVKVRGGEAVKGHAAGRPSSPPTDSGRSRAALAPAPPVVYGHIVWIRDGEQSWYGRDGKRSAQAPNIKRVPALCGVTA